MTETNYATGRRKTSVARVWLSVGNGDIIINRKPVKDYFKMETLIAMVKQPLEITKALGRYNIMATVRGGGVSSQAGAVRHGLSRVLAELYPEHKQNLKKSGLLTRDPRMKERKKYGQPGARKRFQFSKR